MSAFASSSAAVDAANRLADVDLPAVAPREGGPEAVRDLVHHDRRQVPFGRSAPRLRRIHHAGGKRQDHFLHPCVHEVLEEDLLGPLLFVDARIVGQVVGDRLVAVPQIAGPERRVHHLHRRHVAADRWPILRRRSAARPESRAPTADTASGCGSPARCESGRPRRTRSSRRGDRRGRSRTARRSRRTSGSADRPTRCRSRSSRR